MPRQKMEELLAQLRSEVAGQQLSDSQRARMEALQDQIEEGLTAEEVLADSTLREHVRSQIDEFQLAHPTLTMVLGRILDHLNKMGV
ncbi:MAG: DUF4404 family protein [Gammaproteobacteria bacterium]